MKNGFTFVDTIITLFIMGLFLALFLPIFLRAFQTQEIILEKNDANLQPSGLNKIVIFEGCEYIESITSFDARSTNYSLCHKGNCTNWQGHKTWDNK